MHCKICNTKVDEIFKAKVLGKYQVAYYQCQECLFVQTEEPYWLQEAYTSAITALDIGLVQRNLELSNIVACIIHSCFHLKHKFIDFAGGYGLMVRLLRDKGLNFYRQDKYCENLFAGNFDVKDLTGNEKFELLTAFEVFEHLQNPLQEIDEMLSYADSILFSTRLQPHADIRPDNWWYISPEIGQHIAFYHTKTLSRIAELKGLNLYTNHQNIHLLTKKKINPFLFKNITRTFTAKAISLLLYSKKSSLQQKDYSFIKNKLFK